MEKKKRLWLKKIGIGVAGIGLSNFNSYASPVVSENLINSFEDDANLILLRSNENPYGPSEKAKKAVIQSLSQGNRYAFAELGELQKIIADKEGVDPSYVLIGAGSGELLCQTGVAYGLDGGRVLSAYPTFPLLMNYAEQMNAKWDRIDLNDKLEFDYDKLLSAIQRDTKLVFSCNPNNPTGSVVDTQVVKSFCEEASKKTLVYADEAYIEFLEPAQQKING